MSPQPSRAVYENDDTAKQDSLVNDADLGDLLIGKLVNVGLPAKPVGELKLFFNTKTMADM